MKKLLTLIITILTITAFGQEIKVSLKISDIEFRSIFGVTKKEPKNTYC